MILGFAFGLVFKCSDSIWFAHLRLMSTACWSSIRSRIWIVELAVLVVFNCWSAFFFGLSVIGWFNPKFVHSNAICDRIVHDSSFFSLFLFFFLVWSIFCTTSISLITLILLASRLLFQCVCSTKIKILHRTCNCIFSVTLLYQHAIRSSFSPSSIHPSIYLSLALTHTQFTCLLRSTRILS